MIAVQPKMSDVRETPNLTSPDKDPKGGSECAFAPPSGCGYLYLGWCTVFRTCYNVAWLGQCLKKGLTPKMLRWGCAKCDGWEWDHEHSIHWCREEDGRWRNVRAMKECPKKVADKDKSVDVSKRAGGEWQL